MAFLRPEIIELNDDILDLDMFCTIMGLVGVSACSHRALSLIEWSFHDESIPGLRP